MRHGKGIPSLQQMPRLANERRRTTLHPHKPPHRSTAPAAGVIYAVRQCTLTVRTDVQEWTKTSSYTGCSTPEDLFCNRGGSLVLFCRMCSLLFQKYKLIWVRDFAYGILTLAGSHCAMCIFSKVWHSFMRGNLQVAHWQCSSTTSD